MPYQRIARAVVGFVLGGASLTMAGCQQNHATTAEAAPTPITSTAPTTAAPATTTLSGQADDCQKAHAVVSEANADTKSSLLMPITAEKASDMESAAAQIRAAVATLEAPDVKPTMLRYAADMEQVALHLRKAQASSPTDPKELEMALNADEEAVNEVAKLTFACANQKGTTTMGGTTTQGGTTTKR